MGERNKLLAWQIIRVYEREKKTNYSIDKIMRYYDYEWENKTNYSLDKLWEIKNGGTNKSLPWQNMKRCK